MWSIFGARSIFSLGTSKNDPLWFRWTVVGDEGIFFHFFLEMARFQFHIRPCPHVSPGALVAAGRHTVRRQRRSSSQDGRGGSAGIGSAAARLEACDGMCFRCRLVMNICMSHNIGTAVILMWSIFGTGSIFSPKSEPE